MVVEIGKLLRKDLILDCKVHRWIDDIYGTLVVKPKYFNAVKNFIQKQLEVYLPLELKIEDESDFVGMSVQVKNTGLISLKPLFHQLDKSFHKFDPRFQMHSSIKSSKSLVKGQITAVCDKCIFYDDTILTLKRLMWEFARARIPIKLCKDTLFNFNKKVASELSQTFDNITNYNVSLNSFTTTDCSNDVNTTLLEIMERKHLDFSSKIAKVCGL